MQRALWHRTVAANDMRTCLEFSECPAPSSIKWKFTEMTKTQRDLYGDVTYVCTQQFYINSQIVFSTESERETVKRIQRTEDSRLQTADRGRQQHDAAKNAILVYWKLELVLDPCGPSFWQLGNLTSSQPNFPIPLEQ